VATCLGTTVGAVRTLSHPQRLCCQRLDASSTTTASRIHWSPDGPRSNSAQEGSPPGKECGLCVCLVSTTWLSLHPCSMSTSERPQPYFSTSLAPVFFMRSIHPLKFWAAPSTPQ
jgi:hypothetical protein